MSEIIDRFLRWLWPFVFGTEPPPADRTEEGEA